MLLYPDKKALIQKAHEYGSKAKTFAGAMRFMRKRLLETNYSRFVYRTYQNPYWERDAKAKKKYIDERHYIRFERWLNSQGKLTDRQKEARKRKRDRTICKKAEIYLQENWPYNYPSGKWAGGDVYVYIRIVSPDKVNVSTETVRVWSSNKKWSGNDLRVDLAVSRRALLNFPTLITPDGLALLDAKKVAPREYQIVWLEQHGRLGLKKVSGWLIKGYHAKTDTLEDARSEASLARKKAATALWEKRIQLKNELSLLRRTWVGVQDSLDAGNCAATTNAVVKQLQSDFGKIGGIRADVLLRYRDDIYTRRAIAQAMRRSTNDG